MMSELYRTSKWRVARVHAHVICHVVLVDRVCQVRLERRGSTGGRRATTGGGGGHAHAQTQYDAISSYP